MFWSIHLCDSIKFQDEDLMKVPSMHIKIQLIISEVIIFLNESCIPWLGLVTILLRKLQEN